MIAAMAAGCNAEELPESNSRVTVLHATTSDTKTTLDGDSVLWCDGDIICVNGFLSDPLELESPSATADFTINGVLGDEKKALYPASRYKNATVVTLPATQSYSEETFASGTVPMVAYTASGSNLSFKQLSCLLKLTVKKASDTHIIKYIEFRGNDGEQVCGDFTVDYANATLTGTSDATADKAIRLSANTAITAEGTVFYLAIPGRTFEHGFTIKVADEAGHFMTKSKATSTDLEAGHIHPMAAFEFIPTGTELSGGADFVDYPFTGTVSCGGVPLEGVAVSDGVHVTKTDANGRYWLDRAPSETDFILLSTPSGYETTRSGILPMNWAVVDKEATGTQEFNFELKAVDQSSYKLYVFADMHLTGRNTPAGAEFTQFSAYNTYINSLAGAETVPVYGVNLGDMTQKEYWDKGGSFDAYLEAFTPAFPVYSVIGNHDHDHKQTTDYAAAAEYREALGPTYYSFNIGAQHYIVIDNMVFDGTDTDEDGVFNEVDDYTTVLDALQTAWMEKDIAAAPESTTDYVLLTHCPISEMYTEGEGTSTKTHPRYVMRGGKSVMGLFGTEKRITVLSGHSHMMSSFRFYGSKATQYVHTSTCGTAWYSSLCHDGSPASMHRYTFSGSAQSREMVPLDYSTYGSRRYRLYASGITTQSGYIRPRDDGYGAAAKAEENNRSSYPIAVNLDLYEWQPSWTVKVFENDVEQEGQCYPVARVDFDHRDMCDNGTIPVTSSTKWLSSIRTLHTIQYRPSATGVNVRFEVYDQNDNLKYSIPNTLVQ